MDNTLYYGDNLPILREHVPDESVDLIYLDPPFNSSRTYNLLFKQHKGDPSAAQIMAFEDTWSWSPRLYDEFMSDSRNTRLFDLVDSLYRMLGRSDMMAYLLMMAPRLVELRRTLKPTGSLYLHCDPVASHYLKIILDAVFGPTSFRNDITWKRTTAHGDARRKFADVADTLLFYAKTHEHKFSRQYVESDPEYVEQFYGNVEADTGRRYALDNITSPNPRPNLTYEWRGFAPPTNGWRYALDTMEKLYAAGRIVFTETMRPRVKRYADELKGHLVSCVWTDIKPIQAGSRERRGYPTQKPLALLERIIGASSNEGDVVMDPFAGCGTAVVAAERMGRQWVGIDITYLAIAEVIYRLSTEDVAGRKADYRVIGSPTDAFGARKFFEQTAPQNHKPFEMWAVSLVRGEPIEKKGGDRGIDGRIPVYSSEGKLLWGVIQVKGGHLTPAHIRDFRGVIERENAPFGLFICLDEPSKQMRQEAEELGFSYGWGAKRIPRLQILTIENLLEEHTVPELPEGYIPTRTQGVGRASSQRTFGY